MDPESEASIPAPEQAPRTEPSGPAARPEERRKHSTARTVLEIVVIVAAAFAIAMLVQAFIVKPFTIHQVSMRPTLQEGDRILINRLSYHFRDPKRGDIIVFHSPVTEGEDLVKRVVGLPGDRIAVSNGKLYVNGVAQSEPYLLEQNFNGTYPETGDQPLVVPDGKLFVMGDNRNNSGDSRFFGPIDRSAVMGCAFVVYWPIGHWKGL